MPLNYTPKKESELSNFEPLPKGEYPFTVLGSDEAPSKSAKNAGKIMVKVKLNVHGPNGDRHVYDYFADWFSEWKLKHFCETTGRGADYISGKIDARNNSFAGCEGYCKLEIENDPQFGAKNTVKDYLPDENQKVDGLAAAATPTKPRTPDDDVPF